MLSPDILVIHQKPESIAAKLREQFKGKGRIITAGTAFDGLSQAAAKKPLQIIVSANLPDLSGLSVASILKKADFGSNILVYLVDIDEMLPNTTADFMQTRLTPFTLDLLSYQVYTNYKEREVNGVSMEVAKSLEYQTNLLPSAITTKDVCVHHIFSAYNHLAGDSCNYWLHKTDTSTYIIGYLLDCTGHGLYSFAQVGTLWYLLRHNLLSYQDVFLTRSLAEVMANLNNDYGECSQVLNTASVLIFKIDIERRVLSFVPAGIPFYLTRKKGEQGFSPIFLTSYLLGYEKDSVFEEITLSLDCLSDVVFLTDGMSSLLLQPPQDVLEKVELFSAKDDDATAIFCHFDFSMSKLNMEKK